MSDCDNTPTPSWAEKPADGFAALKSSVVSAASPVHSRWHRYVEWEDLIQQLWLWVAANQEDVATLGPAQLTKVLRAEAEKYCRREKAQRAGYDITDEYYYTVGQLRRIVWDAFDPEATPPGEPYREDEQYAEWVTAVADVRAAIRRPSYPLKHYTALREHVTDGREYDSGVRQAVWALQRQLGGSRPK
jgi:hypothetical protein